MSALDSVWNACIGAGGVASVLVPYLAWRGRRAARRRAQLETAQKAAADAEEKHRKRDQAEAIKSAVADGMAAVRDDVIARIEESDNRTEHIRTALTTEIKALQMRAEQTDLRLARELGGNGGGIRQAIDTTAREMAGMKSWLRGLGERFEDHLEQARDDRAQLRALQERVMREAGQ